MQRANATGPMFICVTQTFNGESKTKLLTVKVTAHEPARTHLPAVQTKKREASADGVDTASAPGVTSTHEPFTRRPEELENKGTKSPMGAGIGSAMGNGKVVPSPTHSGNEAVIHILNEEIATADEAAARVADDADGDVGTKGTSVTATGQVRMCLES